MVFLSILQKERKKQWKWIMNFATWNVQRFGTTIEEIVNGTQKLNIDLLALSET